MRLLNSFHLSCLRRILRVKWQDKITNTEILARTNMSTINSLLERAQARWAGHITRMDENRIPKQLLYGELADGHRSRGRPKLRFKDCLKSTLKTLEIPSDTWEERALDRPGWRSKLHKGSLSAENHRKKEAEDKRLHRKAKTSARTSPPPDSTLKCPVCNRTFLARIGLISPPRTHNPPE